MSMLAKKATKHPDPRFQTMPAHIDIHRNKTGSNLNYPYHIGLREYYYNQILLNTQDFILGGKDKI